MTKILLTGGAGFIGSHILENLVEDKKIKKIVVIDHLVDGSLKNIKNIISNKKVFFHKVNIKNYKKIEKLFKKIDVVIHLAAMSDIVPSIIEPINYLHTNILGTLNVLEAMRSNNVRKIIYSASSSCYGLTKSYPTDEKVKIDTRYPYAFSKFIGENLLKHWSQVYKINYVSLRLFNVYGLRSRTHGAYGAAIGVFLKQKISNVPLTIVGDGKQKRDFINVKDVAIAFNKSIFLKKKNVILNIGSSKPIAVNYLASLISNRKIHIPKRPGEPDMTYANISKAKKILNWKPKISIDDGISELLKNISYWKNAPLWTKKKIKSATKSWFKYLK